MTKTRRDFLKLLGGLGGALVLSSCTWSGGSKDSPLPNGYAFYRLFSTGDQLPGSGEAEFIPPFVKIQDNNQIIFHAGDVYQRNRDGLSMGLYELGMDYGELSPQITGLHKIVRAGDSLPDGKTVFQVQLADLNHNGSVAVRLLCEEDVSQSLYLERNRSGGSSDQGLQKVLGYQTETPDGENVFGAALGNFDLFENDDILVASYWAAKGDASNGESLFYLPGGSVDSSGSILINAGEQLSGSDNFITKLGLMHGFYSDGEYALQVHTDEVQSTDASNAGAAQSPGSAVIKGSIKNSDASQTSLIAASSGLAVSAAARAQTRASWGDVYFGPRINSAGNVAVVTHPSSDFMVLTVGTNIITQTGLTTPTGMIIAGIGGPVMGPDGLIYYVAASNDKEELLVTNGFQTATILGTGARLFGDQGPYLTTIAFGYAKEQVDGYGRLVFVGEFSDNSLGVMLGLPI